MPSSEPAVDPLGDIQALTHELASLEAQLNSRKISSQEYEAISRQLRERISQSEAMAYALAKTNESIAEKLRGKNYGLAEVQQLCNHFIYGSKMALDPEFGADRVPKYFVEAEGGARAYMDTALLERMVDIGILKASLFEKILVCPKCGTPSNVFARFKCTNCASIDISINRMLEHLSCGTIHNEKSFRVGRSMICPTCKKPLQKPAEQRLIGLVCTCNKCGAHFEDPAQSFYCRKCETDFNLQTGIITDIQVYDMNEKIIGEIRSQLGVPIIADLLEKNNFQLDIPGRLAGKGRNVQFSIVARKDAFVAAIDLASSDSEISVGPILEFYVKLLEAKPDFAIFGAIPRLSEQAKDVAATNRISVAEGATAELLARNILAVFGEGVFQKVRK